MDPEALQGLNINKYIVKRSNGDPMGKHHDYSYYVLDLTHDKFAKIALIAYIEACREEYPKLAESIEVLLEEE